MHPVQLDQSTAASEAASTPRKPLYLQIAQDIERQIHVGTLRLGEKVPSIRELRRQRRVSTATVLQAYFWLENRGCIEARSRSGFYVRTPYAELNPEPSFRLLEPVPRDFRLNAILSEILEAASNPANVPLAAACASPELFPNWRLNKLLASITRQNPIHSAGYLFPPGAEELRRQIARRAGQLGCNFAPRDIVVTCGAMEALNLGLRAVAKPGDLIAVESPTFFAILQMIESLGMRAVEIPTHPRTGMDLGVLERSITRHSIKACITIPNCHNPLGYVLPDDAKKDLVELTARRGVAVIEDDAFGDLAFQEQRPYTAKSFDRKGLVLLCSSFSKVLAAGFRVGWLQAGRYRTAVEQLKFINTIASPSLPQLVIAKFLESGGYDRHIRRLRTTVAHQVQMVSRAINKYFPPGARVSRPAGGYLLWVELPRGRDAFQLYRMALRENISILPGLIFSPSRRFKNCVRINCAIPWSDSLDAALRRLGILCEKC